MPVQCVRWQTARRAKCTRRNVPTAVQSNCRPDPIMATDRDHLQKGLSCHRDGGTESGERPFGDAHKLHLARPMERHKVANGTHGNGGTTARQSIARNHRAKVTERELYLASFNAWRCVISIRLPSCQGATMEASETETVLWIVASSAVRWRAR